MKQFSLKEQDDLLDILKRHAQKLKAFKGVHSVDVGYKIKDGSRQIN